MARDVMALAAHLNRTHRVGEPITLVSLARAGTPVGVLLKRTLAERFGREVAHYSVSIIRDRGLDLEAMNYILKRHRDTSIAFVDGWTGKGVISEELAKSVRILNARHNFAIDESLYVLSDLAGVAGYSPSFDDYLIPSSILNATVSGLVSRTILNFQYIRPEDFHGCIYYSEFENIDLSRSFVDAIFTHVRDTEIPLELDAAAAQAGAKRTNTDFIHSMMWRTGSKHRNYVKPGVGESTRVLLRRVPDCLFLQDVSAPSTQHLVTLANEKSVPIIEDRAMPYKATAIIKIMD